MAKQAGRQAGEVLVPQQSKLCSVGPIRAPDRFARIGYTSRPGSLWVCHKRVAGPNWCVI